MAPSLEQLGLITAGANEILEAHRLSGGQVLTRKESLKHDAEILVQKGARVKVLYPTPTRGGKSATMDVKYKNGEKETVGIAADVFEWTSSVSPL